MVSTFLKAIDTVVRCSLTDVFGERPLELEKQLVPSDSTVLFLEICVVT